MHTFYKPGNISETKQKILSFLTMHKLRIEDIDLVITGKNGDITNDTIYDKLIFSVFNNTALAKYKHLCGEYPTSSSFALWLASNIIVNSELPEIVMETVAKPARLKKILIYNHTLNKYHSLMLVSAS